MRWLLLLALTGCAFTTTHDVEIPGSVHAGHARHPRRRRARDPSHRAL